MVSLNFGAFSGSHGIGTPRTTLDVDHHKNIEDCIVMFLVLRDQLKSLMSATDELLGARCFSEHREMSHTSFVCMFAGFYHAM